MPGSWRVVTFVLVPLLASAVLAVAASLPARGRTAPSPWRSPASWAVLLAGLAAIALHRWAPGPVPLAAAGSLWAILALFPASLAGPGAPPFDPARRLPWILLAFLLLYAAFGAQRYLGLSYSLAQHAVDQLGDVRLAGFRPGLGGSDTAVSLAVQLLLVFPFFLTMLPALLPGGPLLVPLFLVGLLQAAWHLASGPVLLAAARRHLPDRGSALAVLAVGVALHPLVHLKASSDFIPPGTVLFLVAWWAERERRSGWLAAALALAALSHPVQSAMAGVWALDHARRAWGTGEPGPRRRALAVAAATCTAAAVPLATLLLAPLVLPPGESLVARLAPYGRQWLSTSWDAAGPSLVPALGLANLARLALFLLPLGFLPVLRADRFLVYAAPEFAYSMASLFAFTHGSQQGFLGLMACAALENLPRLGDATVRRASRVALLSLLPLSLFAGGMHLGNDLLLRPPRDDAARLAAVLDPADRGRLCVGTATSYVVLEERCRLASPLRFSDGSPSTAPADADVVVLDLRALDRPRTLEPPPGILPRLNRWLDGLFAPPSSGPAPFALPTEPHPDDLDALAAAVASGERVATAWRDGVLRIDRAGPGAAADPAAAEGVERMAALARLLRVGPDRPRPPRPGPEGTDPSGRGAPRDSLPRPSPGD